MHDQLAALADASRWRIAVLLAERPRSVGVVAELCGLRQPQATKHLQTLERAGLAVSRRAGNRRIYAIEADQLETLAREVAQIAELAARNSANRERFDAYAQAVESETRAAEHDRWADERQYTLSRMLEEDAPSIWKHLTDPSLLSKWWTTTDLRLSRLRFVPTPGEKIIQEYVDAEDAGASPEIVGRAIGVMEEVVEGERIAFRLSPQLPDGTTAFTAHYEWMLATAPTGSELCIRIRLSESTVPAAEFIAGIQAGWDQSLDNLVAALDEPADVHRTIRSNN